ncbi:hypothetical protein [Streptomyces sp. B27]|uniref:hypothetical protein n=1 Tax=Streptomyces sp. B27 TaxID=2485015 RepID=UPI000FD972CE|nr:hypothetical protein [Streptomyces sp. B27]
MNRLPRPVADLICLGRDLVRHPRMVLLNRGHHRWTPAGLIAAAAIASAGTPAGHYVLVAATLIAGPFWALDVLGALSHGLWQAGRIWSDLECQCCGDDPDDEDDDPVPDEPEDDGGLAADVENWLKTQTTRH